MNINDIKANIGKHGFVRPNLFRVKIAKVGASEQATFRINCFQAQIPGNNVATTDPKDASFRSIAYHKIFADIILGFYCSGDMKELHFFQDWMNKIVDNRTNHKGYYNDYVSNIEIEQLSRSVQGTYHKKNFIGPRLENDNENQVLARWKLYDAYPKQIDPVQLDYGTNDTVMTMNTSITYRNFTHEFGNGIVRHGHQDLQRDELGRRISGTYDDNGVAVWNENTVNTWKNPF